jgi:hypothetical protein
MEGSVLERGYEVALSGRLRELARSVLSSVQGGVEADFASLGIVGTPSVHSSHLAIPLPPLRPPSSRCASSSSHSSPSLNSHQFPSCN